MNRIWRKSVSVSSFVAGVLALTTTFGRAAALEWRNGPTYRSASLSVPTTGKPGFTQLPPSITGVTFTNRLSAARYTTNQIYLNGSGVALGDVDGDGWCDVYLCGLDGPNVLYRNKGGWQFEDITATAGVGCENLDATGAAFADLDGDGDLDLVVNSVATGTEIFLNDGKGHFSKVAVLNQGKGGMSLALADIDGDGDLDLYVTNYRADTLRDHPNTRFRVNRVDGKLVVLRVNDRPVTEPDLAGRYSVDANGKIFEHGEVDALYRNDGHGRFTPVSFTDGTFLDEDGKALTAPPDDWGLSVMFRDINGDGAPDIYVCNDFNSPDRVWINTGDGHFRALPRLSLRHTSMFSMGIDFADLNHDGYDDFFVADMLSRHHAMRHVQTGDLLPSIQPVGLTDNRPQFARNTVFLNCGDGTYAEIGWFSQLEASEWSWAPIFLDVDLDGWEDLLITTGHERDARNADIAQRIQTLQAQKKMSVPEMLELRRMFPRLDVPNLAFRNRGDLTFEECSSAWGFNAPGVSHGMALADLDNDGDLDLVVNNLNGAAGIYRNETSAPRVAVRLKGNPPNTRGIGARIKVFGGAVPLQTQEVICGGRYLSGDDPVRVFAAGSVTNQLRIEVIWRNGTQSVVEDAQPNRVYEIDEKRAVARAQSGDPERRSVAGVRRDSGEAPGSPNRVSPVAFHPAPLFEDVSHLIEHIHHEESFDDYARQPLLPNKLSQLGPGVAWFDVDGDGWEDLIVGSGRGGHLTGFRNDGKGGFQRMQAPPLTQPVTRDQTTVLGWQREPGQAVLLAGSANYEDGLEAGAMVRQYDLNTRVPEDILPGQPSSTGPLAMADIDGDGDLDLFVGGRVVPGRYPEAATSILFRNDAGKFVIAHRFDKIGLVSGAVFSDLDGDGWAELILACEWGPIRIFHNDRGSFREVTRELGLADFRGWWNGVATGDLDGDGRLDIVASNWGLNSKYRASREHPRRLYYADFAGRGTVDLIEACFDAELGKEVPDRTLKPVGAAIPLVIERIQTHSAFGTASVQEILGEQLKSAGCAEVTTLASMVFLNRGNRFEARALEQEAQFAPAFGVCIGDLDGDGHEDVFLSQNFFATNPDGERCDSGRGLCLRGDGKGGFAAVPASESGLRIYGEQRGAATADFNADGRVDLVVTQNGAATKLYRNVGAKPGLRVRVSAGPGNPAGVGAAMRLMFGDRPGPVREVQSGAGYWSQNSAVQVLATPEPPTRIWVRWPGGRETTSDLPTGAKEISVNAAGEVKALR